MIKVLLISLALCGCSQPIVEKAKKTLLTPPVFDCQKSERVIHVADKDVDDWYPSDRDKWYFKIHFFSMSF